MTLRHGGLRSDPSASKAEMFVECTASHVLGQAPARSEQADRGTEGHRPLTDTINGTGQTLQEERDRVVRLLREFTNVPMSSMRAEAAYVVNVRDRTSRLVGVDIGRAYGKLGPYDFPVSLDVEAVVDEDTVWIRDWKFGTYSNVWQLHVQAMAVLFPEPGPKPPKAPSQFMVDAGFVYFEEGRKPREETYAIGLMDLDEKAEQLAKAFDRVKYITDTIRNGGTPRLSQGPWCKYCPAQDHCPAKWSMIRAALGEMQGMDSIVEAMTLEKCGQAWHWVKEVEKFRKKAETVLRDRLEREGGFPLPNGKTLVLEQRSGKKTVDMKRTMALLEELGATEEQKSSVINVGADSLYAMERKLA